MLCQRLNRRPCAFRAGEVGVAGRRRRTGVQHRRRFRLRDLVAQGSESPGKVLGWKRASSDNASSADACLGRVSALQATTPLAEGQSSSLEESNMGLRSRCSQVGCRHGAQVMEGILHQARSLECSPRRRGFLPCRLLRSRSGR